MKATGIVRRVEECVIIGQTAPNPHKHYGFRWFAPLNALVSKTGFNRFLHNKREVIFHLAFSLHYHKRTVPLCSEYSSANTAHKKCEKALMKLKEAIKDLI